MVRAAQQIKKLSKKNRDIYPEIKEGIESLKNYPNVSGIKTLNNHEYGYRLKVGNYRIFFDVNNSVRVIDIQEVKKRNENTYKLS